MNELRENPEIVLKHRNCLNFLSNRQLGETAGVRAKTEFYQMKTSLKEKVASTTLAIPCSYDSCEVNFLKGDAQSLFGVWRLSNDHQISYVMGEINYMNRKRYVPETYKPCENIIDMCRSPTGFITVCNYPPLHSPSVVKIYNTPIRIQDKYPLPWHCCSFMAYADLALIGCNKFGITVTGQGQHAYLKSYANICSLTHCDVYGTLLVGQDDGRIRVISRYDGPEDAAYYVRMSDKAINDSFIVDDNEIIATDVEGRFLKVDLRTRKILAFFFGHKHSVTKRPFSVTNDMVCATGADNVVRIWHISGGLPIYELKPTSSHEVRSWIHCAGNKTYLNYFEGDTMTVFAF